MTGFAGGVGNFPVKRLYAEFMTVQITELRLCVTDIKDIAGILSLSVWGILPWKIILYRWRDVACFSICTCQVAARDATDKDQPVEMGVSVKSGRLTQFGLEAIQSLFLKRADAIMKECFESQNINRLN